MPSTTHRIRLAASVALIAALPLACSSSDTNAPADGASDAASVDETSDAPGDEALAEGSAPDGSVLDASAESAPDSASDASYGDALEAASDMAVDAIVIDTDAADDALDAPVDAPSLDAAEHDALADAGNDTGPDAPDLPPPIPPKLTRYLTGSAADSPAVPQGPGLILMGGGADVDAAFAWWKPMIAGGDVVVLRTSGADGYNPYLFQDIGGCDSVETLLVTTSALADDPYVAWALAHAEGIFLAGGDQSTYLQTWKGTAVETALQQAWTRGAVIGGTSAGCAVLGEFSFAAYNGTILSGTALANPYAKDMTLERDFLAFPPLSRVIADTHFFPRDRMGRLVTFLARIEQDDWADPVLGIGVDEATALLVGPAGGGHVVGSGHVYLVKSNGKPTLCAAGKPLSYPGLTVHRLAAGDSVQLPDGTTSVPGYAISVQAGVVAPANPY